MSDLIDRQSAIDALEKEYRCTDQLDDWDGLKTAMLIIENLPPAQPERPKGHWMLCDNQRREDIENGNYMYTCTNCLHSDVHAKTVTVPFCWNCGAKMEETK